MKCQQANCCLGTQLDVQTRDTGAMLDTLSCEAIHWEWGQFVEFIGSEVNLLASYLPVQWNDVKYIISTTAVQIWISYIFHIIALHGKIRLQQIDLVPNVSLHSSVGRASHRYRGGHGFETRWSPDIFQASSFQFLKLENLLRWSLFTFIYNRSTDMDFIYIFHIVCILL